MTNKERELLLIIDNIKHKVITTTKHKVKCSKYFNDIISGKKTADIRKNDRNYKVGDLVEFQEYLIDVNTGKYKYTNRSVTIMISHIIPGGKFGLESGYCMLSFVR